jgi:uncharacterized protein (DUF433 family)
MSLMPSTPIRPVPGLLRARGLRISVNRIRDALQSGIIPGRREQRYWVLTPEDVEAAERYFRQADVTTGGQKAGAAGLEQVRRRSRRSLDPS